MLLALADACDSDSTLTWSTAAQLHVSGLPKQTGLDARRAVVAQGLIEREPISISGRTRRQRFVTRLNIADKDQAEPVSKLQSARAELAWLRARQAKLVARDALVFIAINSFCVDWRTGEGTATNEHIAEVSGVAVRRLQCKGGALDGLERAGLLRRSGPTRGRRLRVFEMPKNPAGLARQLRADWKSSANIHRQFRTNLPSIPDQLTVNSALELFSKPDSKSRARARDPLKRGRSRLRRTHNRQRQCHNRPCQTATSRRASRASSPPAQLQKKRVWRRTR